MAQKYMTLTVPLCLTKGLLLSSAAPALLIPLHHPGHPIIHMGVLNYCATEQAPGRVRVLLLGGGRHHRLLEDDIGVRLRGGVKEAGFLTLLVEERP